MTVRKKPGRPKGSGKPAHRLRDRRIVVLVTAAQLKQFERYAKQEDLKSGPLAYRILNEAEWFDPPEK